VGTSVEVNGKIVGIIKVEDFMDCIKMAKYAISQLPDTLKNGKLV
jgi:hypothetical protein